MSGHTRIQVTLIAVALTLMLAQVASAISGTYVVLLKGGSGLTLSFTEKGTFTSVAFNGRNKRKHYVKGKYTTSGNTLTMTRADGVAGTITIEPNGNLYDQKNNLRLHRYHRRR